MSHVRKTRKKTHVDSLTPTKGRLELKLRESKNVGQKAAKAAVVIEGTTEKNGIKRGTRKGMGDMVGVIIEGIPGEKQLEHSNEIESHAVRTAKIEMRKPGKNAMCVTSAPDENANGSTMRGRKRKAVEVPGEAQKKLVVPEVVIVVPKKDTTRSRKRAKTLAETEAISDGPAIKPPQKGSATKLKTSRLTRNATLLSIAASSLGQTTLNAPPALVCSQSTISTDEPPTPTRETIAVVSTLNTALTVSSKLEEKVKRPVYLTHLINLHSHLLTAIHLHRAQNGTTSSPVFVTLRPHLERLSRRAVELADLRRICWISGFDLTELVAHAKIDFEAEKEENRKRGRKENGTRKKITSAKEEDDMQKVPKGWLKIVDYGNDRVVVELDMTMAGVGEVNNLRREFEKRLDALWSVEQHSVKGKEGEEQGQVLELKIPMAEIVVSENKKLVDTVLKAKGQQRLSDMKGVGVIRGKVHEEKSIRSDKKLTSPASVLVHNTPSTTQTLVEIHENDSHPTGDFTIAGTTATTCSAVTTSPNPTPNSAPAHSTTLSPGTPSITSTAAKKLSLLDRIRAKHQAALLQASTSPTANLSPEEVRLAHLRLCAQQRLPEVIPILRALRLRASGGGIGGVGVGGGKKSLSLEEAVIAVRQSVRNSISWDETEMCIRLAGELVVAAGGGCVHMAGKITKPTLTDTIANTINNTAAAGAAPSQEGEGKLLSRWGGSGALGGAKRDEMGWVEVVECGGLKAVVFK